MRLVYPMANAGPRTKKSNAAITTVSRGSLKRDAKPDGFAAGKIIQGGEVI